jgi:hypothetical protein
MPKKQLVLGRFLERHQNSNLIHLLKESLTDVIDALPNWPVEVLKRDLALPYNSSEILKNKIGADTFKLLEGGDKKVKGSFIRAIFVVVGDEFIERIDSGCLNIDWKSSFLSDITGIQVGQLSAQELLNLIDNYRSVYCLNTYLPGHQNENKIMHIGRIQSIWWLFIGWQSR